MLIPRPLYTDRIVPFLGTPTIKVITGVRRAGKSTIIRLLVERLVSDGVSKHNIVVINMESLEFESIQDHRDLYEFVKSNLHVSGKSYLFVDEVQNISEWERAIASIQAEGLADVTITGSNAHLLDSDLATLLTGRYVEIPVYPLRFSRSALPQSGRRAGIHLSQLAVQHDRAQGRHQPT